MPKSSRLESVLYIAGVISIACVWAGVASALDGNVCAKDESPVVCLRNWISTGGNIAALVVAIAAAAFTFGQYKTAEISARYSASESLRSAIAVKDKFVEQSIRLDGYIRGYMSGLLTVGGGLIDLHTALNEDKFVSIFAATNKIIIGNDYSSKNFSAIETMHYSEAVNDELREILEAFHSKAIEANMSIIRSIPALKYIDKINIESLTSENDPVFERAKDIVRRHVYASALDWARECLGHHNGMMELRERASQLRSKFVLQRKELGISLETLERG